MPRRALFLLVVLTTTSAVLYATRLGYAPAQLMHDELQFALQAESIASSGRDLAGRVLPVFFTEPEFPAGRDPAIIYITAAALTILPFSESSVRLPTALLGVLNVALMFLLARRLFKSDGMAVMAAGALALTPAHFIRSRLVLSPQSSIPFILAWLLCVAALSEKPGERRLAAAAAWLGLGVYTYLACVVMMPLYLALTILLACRSSGWRSAGVAAIAFAVPLVPMAIWYVTHPERLGQVAGAYALASGGVSGVPALADASAEIRARLGLYWSFFSPDFLFLSGDSSLINSTRLAGFFPLSFAVLIPLGVIRIVRDRRPYELLILAGLVTAPLAAVISGAIEMNRILFVIPFGVLAAAYGVDWCRQSPAWIWRAAGIVLVAGIPLQFAGFYQDYMGRYRMTASPWFGGNTREAFTAAINRRAPGSDRPVFVSRSIQFANRYWRFYSIANARRDMLDHIVYFGPEQPDDAPAGALLVCPLVDPACQALTGNGSGWTIVRTIAEPDGTPSLTLLEKAGP